MRQTDKQFSTPVDHEPESNDLVASSGESSGEFVSDDMKPFTSINVEISRGEREVLAKGPRKPWS